MNSAFLNGIKTSDVEAFLSLMDMNFYVKLTEIENECCSKSVWRHLASTNNIVANEQS